MDFTCSVCSVVHVHDVDVYFPPNFSIDPDMIIFLLCFFIYKAVSCLNIIDTDSLITYFTYVTIISSILDRYIVQVYLI